MENFIDKVILINTECWFLWPSCKKKKVIWEKTYFLESSKVLGLIKPKRKDNRKKWD
jgi:hypothetical protein